MDKFAIFASNLPETRVNAFLRDMDIPHKCLNGGYTMESGEVVVEPSWLVPFRGLRWTRPFWEDQESIMLLSETHYKPPLRNATLWFPGTDARIDLGYLRQVDRATAEASPGWSHEPSTGHYWTAS